MRTRTWLRRLDRLLTSLMAVAEALLDAAVTRFGRVYIGAAAVLISLVAAVFFAAVIPELAASRGLLHAGGHAAFGLVLLGNVAFNYAQCVRTPPGTPEDLSHEVLAAAAEAGRYCHTCGWPKPEAAHHCHICNRCILKMDHHCPWMNTCIGANNYRYFLLTLVWMEAGAAYAAVMTIRRMVVAAAAVGETWHEAPLPLLFVGILSASMACALGLLLGWHIYLAASSQSTIDFHNHWARAVEAKRSGQRWARPPHPTAGQNLQDIFDVHGRWWYIMWLLPRWPQRNPQKALQSTS